MGRTFDLRRALLVTTGEPRYQGLFGAEDEEVPSGVIEKLENELREQGTELVHSYNAQHTLVGDLLAKYKFNYLFSLWYEDNLTGLLLLDTSPRIFLDQDEPILLGLCRQISHSIETCRVVEEKIGLEKTLLQQEHLVVRFINPLTYFWWLAQAAIEVAGAILASTRLRSERVNFHWNGLAMDS